MRIAGSFPRRLFILAVPALIGCGAAACGSSRAATTTVTSSSKSSLPTTQETTLPTTTAVSVATSQASTSTTSTALPGAGLAALVTSGPTGYVSETMDNNGNRTGTQSIAQASTVGGPASLQAEQWIAGQLAYWDRPASSGPEKLDTVELILNQFAAPSGAAQFEQVSGQQSFAVPGVPGAEGETRTTVGETLVDILYTKGPYSVEITSLGGDVTVAMIQALAASEYGLLPG